MKKERDPAIQKVMEQTDKESAGDDGLMLREADVCAELFLNEVKPLIGFP